MKAKLAVSFAALLALVACGDDSPADEENAADASQLPLDAGQDGRVSPIDATTADATLVVDAGALQPKAACSLLTAAEVGAVLGVAQKASELVAGMQCQFSSADAERKSVRALLEVVDNGRAIYEANLRMYAEAGKAATPQSGVGDQAAFVSESVVRSSMMTTRGDVLLRLNLGWGDPGVDSATQLQGERTLLTAALERL